MSNLVLYHSNCADGGASAYVAHRALGNGTVCKAVQYGQPYPEVVRDGWDHIYLVDFSYPASDLASIKLHCERLTIIDHHKTAEKPLADFAATVAGLGKIAPCVQVIFDLEHCGAVLTWKHFYPNSPVPTLLEYVEDRDLWKWEKPDSKEVSAAIASYPFHIGGWDDIWATPLDDLAEQGTAILRYQKQQVGRHVVKAKMVQIAGYEVPVVNATSLQSEIGEALCFKYPDHPFAACYFVNEEGKRVYSLRSRNGFDVSAVAKTMGGGGHAAAAGFTE